MVCADRAMRLHPKGTWLISMSITKRCTGNCTSPMRLESSHGDACACLTLKSIWCTELALKTGLQKHFLAHIWRTRNSWFEQYATYTYCNAAWKGIWREIRHEIPYSKWGARKSYAQKSSSTYGWKTSTPPHEPKKAAYLAEQFNDLMVTYSGQEFEHQGQTMSTEATDF